MVGLGEAERSCHETGEECVGEEKGEEAMVIHDGDPSAEPSKNVAMWAGQLDLRTDSPMQKLVSSNSGVLIGKRTVESHGERRGSRMGL